MYVRSPLGIHRLNEHPFCQVKTQFPFLKEYHNTWPVILLARQFMNNHRGNNQKKAKKNATDNDQTPQDAGTSAAANDTDPNGNENGDTGGQDNSLSDVVLSDMEE